ncbi:hypothetical protein G7046_g2556 [Stylonectria norvegica]|nr:hypothetical protein G7046_g2556 [Stylonectria norvegica]
MRASTYKRPAVEIPYDPREADLIEAVRRLDFEETRRDEKARRLAKKEEKKEDEAQRQRLMERMMPRRRATVGPGSRRHRVLYDDGVYRWEIGFVCLSLTLGYGTAWYSTAQHSTAEQSNTDGILRV